MSNEAIKPADLDRAYQLATALVLTDHGRRILLNGAPVQLGQNDLMTIVREAFTEGCRTAHVEQGGEPVGIASHIDRMRWDKIDAECSPALAIPYMRAEIADLRNRLAAPAKQSDSTPVGWIDQFGNVFPLAAHSVDGKPNWSNEHKRGWKKLYTHPAPVAPVPLGYVQGKPVFVGSKLEQRVKDGWVAHNAREDWRAVAGEIDWENDLRWPTPATGSIGDDAEFKRLQLRVAIAIGTHAEDDFSPCKSAWADMIQFIDARTPAAVAPEQADTQLKHVARVMADEFIAVHEALGFDSDTAMDSEVMIAEINRLRIAADQSHGWQNLAGVQRQLLDSQKSLDSIRALIDKPAAPPQDTNVRDAALREAQRACYAESARLDKENEPQEAVGARRCGSLIKDLRDIQSPPAQSVALSDDEIKDIVFDVHAEGGMGEEIDMVAFARAIIAHISGKGAM